MGASLNRIILIGRVGRDPEMRYLSEGQARTRFSLATDRPTRAGAEPETDWHQIVCWESAAEFANEYLTKGRLVCVVGRLSYRTYEREGQTYRVTEIVARDVVPLDRRPPVPDAEEADEPDVPAAA